MASHPEAKPCELCDQLEMLFLTLPAICRLLCIKPMEDVEAVVFLIDMRKEEREQENPEPVNSFPAHSQTTENCRLVSR